MAVIIITEKTYYECPICGNDDVEEGQNFCQWCGEAFEWREEYE